MNLLQQTMIQNRELAENVASAFDRARESVANFFLQLTEENPLLENFNPQARVTEEGQSSSLPFNIDFTRANKELQAFTKEAQKELKISASAGGVVAAGTAALNSLKSLFSSTVIPLKVQVSEENTVTPVSAASAAPAIDHSSPIFAATGGRFTERKQIEIAEDGDPEYVIPVKKESLAVPLLRQVMGELSDSAREMLQGEMGKIGGSAAEAQEVLEAAPAAAAPVVQQNTMKSVQAPVSINVTAAGSDPVTVGRSIYDVSERYLLRTLREAM